MTDPARYGVFLRPDPRTALAVSTVTGAVRATYGLVSAGAFPPHVTLAGSLPLTGSETGLTAVLDDALAGVPDFPVDNAGVRRLRSAVVYDVHETAGAPNPALLDLTVRIDAAVRPLLDPDPAGLPADLYRPDRWHGHLSLASHELDVRPELGGEVFAFIRDLDVAVPKGFRADTVILYRFTHPTWSGPWWADLRWTHVRSWPLG